MWALSNLFVHTYTFVHEDVQYISLLILQLHHAILFCTASSSLPTNVNGSPSQLAADDVSIGVGVSVGVVASVLVVVVITSRKRKMCTIDINVDQLF